MHKSEIVDEFRNLSMDEKLALLETLWDEVEGDADAFPLSDEQRAFLDERLNEIEKDPRPDRDWQDVRQELLARK